MKYLCDTNIISELASKHPNQGVIDWAETVSLVDISVITIEEIYFGLSWKPNHRIQNWFEVFIKKYANILKITHEIAKRAGTIRGQLQAQGITRTQADLMIAATAFEHSLTIVTRNTKDFDACGVAILNPFLD